MTDFFKSAFGMFGNQPAGGGANAAAATPVNQQASSSGGGNNRNEFVGQIIQLGNYKLKVTKQLAEGMHLIQLLDYSVTKIITKFNLILGGFAIVYVVQDLTNGTDYALKVTENP
jgi:hypothetical protein